MPSKHFKPSPKSEARGRFRTGKRRGARGSRQSGPEPRPSPSAFAEASADKLPSPDGRGGNDFRVGLHGRRGKHGGHVGLARWKIGLHRGKPRYTALNRAKGPCKKTKKMTPALIPAFSPWRRSRLLSRIEQALGPRRVSAQVMIRLRGRTAYRDTGVGAYGPLGTAWDRLNFFAGGACTP
jgi:hypothetical protein